MRAAAPLIFLLVALLSSHSTNSAGVIDGLADWKSASTTVHLGDCLVFNNKQQRNLYLFRSRRAFDLCNFAQATLVYGGDSSSFTWSPSRPGHYYFSTTNSTTNKCENGEKLTVRAVRAPELLLPSAFSPAPPPTPGGDSSSTHKGWGWVASSPSTGISSPAPQTGPLLPTEGSPPPSTAAAESPESNGIPFISSNPAVPLPTGVTDTATIRPLPTPGDQNQVVGSGASTAWIERSRLLVSVMMMGMGFAFELWM